MQPSTKRRSTTWSGGKCLKKTVWPNILPFGPKIRHAGHVSSVSCHRAKMTKDRDILKELFEVSLSALSFYNISIYNDLLLEVFKL